jgi:hypothetical protein
MGQTTGNFTFLEAHSPQLAKLGRLAERYFSEDPPTSLVKLRQFAEITAREVAARQALLDNPQASFDDILRVLRTRSILQREVAELFYHLKRIRAAVLESLGWRLERVWSTDWWTDKERAAERLHAIIKAILEQDREARGVVDVVGRERHAIVEKCENPEEAGLA